MFKGALLIGELLLWVKWLLLLDLSRPCVALDAGRECDEDRFGAAFLFARRSS